MNTCRVSMLNKLLSVPKIVSNCNKNPNSNISRLTGKANRDVSTKPNFTLKTQLRMLDFSSQQLNMAV